MSAAASALTEHTNACSTLCTYKWTLYAYIICDPGAQNQSEGTIFVEIEIYAFMQNWLYNIFIDAWFVMIGQYLERVQKKSKYWENHL